MDKLRSAALLQPPVASIGLTRSTGEGHRRDIIGRAIAKITRGVALGEDQGMSQDIFDKEDERG